MKPTASDTEAAGQSVLPLDLDSSHHEVVNFLALLGHGECLASLHDDILEAEKAVAIVGKAAEITLKIKISPNGQHKRILNWESKLKKPTAATSSTYAFVTPQGQFLENDPEQRQLDLKVVPMEARTPKVV